MELKEAPPHSRRSSGQEAPMAHKLLDGDDVAADDVTAAGVVADDVTVDDVIVC